jgi:MFS transporter, Spinster family, sphingosine-1-phosphate transporter
VDDCGAKLGKQVGRKETVTAMDDNTGNKRARNTLLLLTTLLLAFNYVDRLVLGLVLQDIKVDLHLSDTLLGFLSGIAFAAFYATMGVPIARLADRGDRVAIISIAAAIWSVCVALCGSATSFIQLLMIRVGVAVGEAGCIPPAQSLVSEFFPRSDRARAFAIYALGGPLSVILGSFVAGWINEYYGWRATFAILGCPGILLALLAWFLISEPRRAASTRARFRSLRPPDTTGESESGPPSSDTTAKRRSFKDVVLALAKNASFRHLLIAQTILYFFVYGIVLQWQPSFFIRTYGFTTGELGTWQLLSWCVMGSIGVYGGGAIVHRFMARDESRQLRLMGVSISIYGVLNILVYLTPYRYVALGLTVLASPFYNCIYGPVFALNQSVVAESMRATAVAIVLFFANLLGMGLGGLATGMLSDALAPIFGADSLRYALLVLTPGFLWCGIHFWLASRTVALDIERANEQARADTNNRDHLLAPLRA